MNAPLQNRSVFFWSDAFAELMSTLSVGFFTSLWGEKWRLQPVFFFFSGSVTSDEERRPSRGSANVVGGGGEGRVRGDPLCSFPLSPLYRHLAR